MCQLFKILQHHCHSRATISYLMYVLAAASCMFCSLSAVECLAVHGDAGLKDYSYNSFREEFGRGTDLGLKEYMRRASIFQASLSEILAVNQRNRQQGRAWAAGPHPFMDWTASERSSLHGYRPGKTPLSVLQVGATVATRSVSNSTTVGDRFGGAVRAVSLA